MVEAVLAAVAVVVCVAATVTDLRSGRIPDLLTLPIVVGAPVAIGLLVGWNAALVSIAGGVLVAIVPAFLYWRGGIGGGDVKLLAGLGILLGPLRGLEAELLAFVFVVLWAGGVLAWRGELGAALLGGARALRGKDLPAAWKVETRFAGAALVAVAAVVAAQYVG